MRVLLIEDDSATAQSIELMLKSEGFNVYTTDLGEEEAGAARVCHCFSEQGLGHHWRPRRAAPLSTADAAVAHAAYLCRKRGC